MNKIVYGLFILWMVGFVGCTQDRELSSVQPNEKGNVVVSFSATIPEFTTISTRANGGVSDMYLLVFDENGNFIVRKQASLSSQTNTGGNFTVELPASSKQRTIHFLSNYDWSGFDDNSKLGVNEAGVITSMTSADQVFWARVTLSSGITATSFSQPVNLLRNQAKISVTSNASGFVYEGFAIHKTPNLGTVAPYSVTSPFSIGAITEPAGVVLNNAVTADISTGEKYIFERRNALATEITTIIVKGTFGGQTYYYKIDLIDASKNRYDIQRNYHYAVTIQTVTRDGYSNFEDALNSPSHNNTALDPIIEKYPMISDGISKLEVEKTLVVLTQPGEYFQVAANYYPNASTGVVDNSGLTTLVQAGSNAIDAGSLSISSGIISGRAVYSLGIDEQKEARIVVSKGDLARTIRVILRNSYSFDPVSINNQSPAEIPNGQSQNAVLRFNIPNDFPEDLFPHAVNIYAQGLYPTSAGLEMKVEEGNIYYIYRATARGAQSISFKTNKSDNSETVRLEADYFTDGTVSYNTYTLYQGNITYNNILLPTSAASSLTVSQGSLALTSNGKYKYTPPSNPNMNTIITMTYSNEVASNRNGQIQQSFHDYYTIQTTIGHLYNNGSLNLSLDRSIVTGRIQYTNNLNNFNNLTNVPSNAVLSVTYESNGATVPGASATMLNTQRYQLIIPGTVGGTEKIRINYTNGASTYYVEVSVNDFRSNQYLRMRTNGGQLNN